MKINFFELKYLIIDSFYTEVLINNRSFRQASGICYEGFWGYISENTLESVVAICELEKLKIRHKIALTEHDLKLVEKALKLMGELNVDSELTTDEEEYLQDDILEIEYKYKQIREKK